MTTKDDELDRWLTWRDQERRKHRFMAAAEYAAWCSVGDAISSPSDGNAFPGGITIDFNSPPIFGRVEDN